MQDNIVITVTEYLWKALLDLVPKTFIMFAFCSLSFFPLSNSFVAGKTSSVEFYSDRSSTITSSCEVFTLENDAKSTNQSLSLNSPYNKHELKPLDCCATSRSCFVTCIGYIDWLPNQQTYPRVDVWLFQKRRDRKGSWWASKHSGSGLISADASRDLRTVHTGVIISTTCWSQTPWLLACYCTS